MNRLKTSWEVNSKIHNKYFLKNIYTKFTIILSHIFKISLQGQIQRATKNKLPANLTLTLPFRQIVCVIK